MPTVETRKNYNTNPRMENSVAGWSVSGTGVTQTPTAAGTRIDFPSGLGSGGLFLYQTASPVAAEAEVWSGLIEVTVPVGFPSVTLVLSTRGYTGGTVHSAGFSASTVIAPGQTVPIAATSLPLIAGANGVRNWLSAGAAIPSGARVVVRRALLAKESPAGEYLDGSLPGRSSLDGAGWDYFSWDGTPDASTSTMVRERRLTPLTDMNPVPRVLVDAPVSLFPVGSVTVSLTRTSEGRTFDVRGGQRMSASAPAIVTDPEPGFGVVSSYTVVGYDVAGKEIGSFPVGTVTVAYSKVVIQQPLDPRLAATVDRLDGTAFELTRSTPGQLAYAQGRVLPGMIGLGPRRGLEGVTLNLVAESAEEADNLQATLGTYDEPQLPVWLVRTPPGKRMPRVFFCHVPELVELDTYGVTNTGFVHFQANVTEVMPPAAGIAGAGLTYSDIAVMFATYTALGAAYATYSDIKRDTSLVGAADA